MAEITKKEVIDNQVIFTFTFDSSDETDSLRSLKQQQANPYAAYQKMAKTRDYDAVYNVVKSALANGWEFGAILQPAIDAFNDHIAKQ